MTCSTHSPCVGCARESFVARNPPTQSCPSMQSLNLNLTLHINSLPGITTRLMSHARNEMTSETMDSFEPDGNGNGKESLPPPPAVVPSDVVPFKVQEVLSTPAEPVKKKASRTPMARRGLGSKGMKIQLQTNHFKVNVTKNDGHFFHYSVAFSYEDGRPVEEMTGTLSYCIAPLNCPNGHGDNESDRKRMRQPYRAKTFKVEISFAAKIPMQAIGNALRGQETENFQEAIRVLDIILRQHAAKQGCLLVRQSFFHNDPKNFADVGGGVLGCRGFHSSFRTTQSGLSLNIDVSTTMIITPGPVVDFLISNQNVRDPFQLDWAKAKRTLKNLRIKTSPSNQEFRITGLSELPCREQTFTLKGKGGVDGEDGSEEITVYDYFVNVRKIDLRYSSDLPCVNVGKPKRPTFFPIELCELVSLQRYTKALSTLQRASLVEKSRQKPQERMRVLSDALKVSNYGSEPLLRNCGISISTGFTEVEGRVLPAPRLKFGNGEDFNPRNGRWNFSNKSFVEPSKIERWAVANFSARCDVRALIRDLIRIGDMKGIKIEQPYDVFDENPQFRRAPPMVRVEKMFETIQSKLPGAPQFLLCLLPDRKNCDIYGPWKKKNLADFGIINQCMCPTRVNDQYLTNVMLKINAKLGGLNSLLGVENSPSLPVVSKAPTLILGMDVSHGSPGQTDIPSIAAVVSSRHWPLISKYRACVRTQSAKVEMIDNLFKQVSEKEDEGIIRELLLDFYTTSGRRKPENIIIFRDGVSESQFNQVLNIELDQIIKGCKFLDETWEPKFVVIVAQKNHHTRFFQPNSPDNVPPGKYFGNFHFGLVFPGLAFVEEYWKKSCIPCVIYGGTSRPTHYHVLHDEVGFSPDEMQELVHSLSYVYQRSTTAISVVAPICYAHLAATQLGQFMKFEDKSDTCSSHGGLSGGGAVPVPQLPPLQENVRNTMFFYLVLLAIAEKYVEAF
ncbi:hypothetical protein Fmac_026594 [Flemingia macrophylla]|uniref:Argonaute 4 n=1 Tax=Flemingia macrophylla TaxID=520843 RepID=A0ABD1LFA7_9FABA